LRLEHDTLIQMIRGLFPNYRRFVTTSTMHFVVLFLVVLSSVLAAVGSTVAQSAGNSIVHAISRHGTPELAAGFDTLPYASIHAKKGGRIIVGQLGTFDSMNPYISRGAVPEVSAGSGINSLIVQSLMMRSLDEPFTLYGLVAESIEPSQDRSSVTFKIHPKARFSDSKPILAEDIKFTFELLKEKGRPAQRNAYRRVKQVDVIDRLTIRFTFSEPDGELPMLLALMPALARHDIKTETFEQPSFKPPLGSGPYKLAEMEPGKSFTLKRDPDFWGQDLPVLKGHFNFDEIRVDFYRDSNALFEAFKVGLVDVRFETDPGKWLEGYDFPAIRDGSVVREEMRFEAPRGMTGIVFNTRKPLLSSLKVREALSEVFDFDWLNRNLFRDVYKRQASYFDQSELSSIGRPADDRERALLAPYKADVRIDFIEGQWAPKKTDGSGRDRQRMQSAISLLGEAGFILKEGRMVHEKTGTPLALEFLALSRDQERIGLAFADSLKPVGVELRVRFVDSSLYWRRLRTFDFDTMIWSYGVTASPGTEQPNRFSSASADREASLNYAGVKSKAVDAMLEALRSASSREEFIAAVRSLDRTLLSGFYVLPLYFAPDRWMARQAGIKRPERQSRYDINFETWWRQ
jgi:peptide/nickel transport system substrate-binding protein